jgi:hypothetical protein
MIDGLLDYPNPIVKVKKSINLKYDSFCGFDTYRTIFSTVVIQEDIMVRFSISSRKIIAGLAEPA